MKPLTFALFLIVTVAVAFVCELFVSLAFYFLIDPAFDVAHRLGPLGDKFPEPYRAALSPLRPAAERLLRGCEGTRFIRASRPPKPGRLTRRRGVMAATTAVDQGQTTLEGT